MSRIAALCTDGDGTLWDTEEMIFGVYADMLAARGRAFTLDDYQSVVGQSSERAAEILLARFGLPDDPVAFIAERRVLSSTRLPTVQALPGAAGFLEACALSGVPMALVSSAVMAHVAVMLDVTGFRKYFTHVVVGDTPELDGKHKPEPDPYLLAARLHAVDPAACLALEDTWHGAMSARRAGMIVVAAPHRFSPRERFTPDVAHYVIPEGESLADFDIALVSHLLPP